MGRTVERLRIARELHDKVAHSIGIIAIQAGVGSRVIETQPAEACEALRAIEATSRETLSGLRHTLVALRQADLDAAVSEQAPLAPSPGLADIERLAAATADAGVRVDVRLSGEQRSLPGDIDLSAYRIVQEALTNVVRHAGTGRCRVAIGYGDEELSVEVVDDGRGATGNGSAHGFGIVGMRERVGLLKRPPQHRAASRGRLPGGGAFAAARTRRSSGGGPMSIRVVVADDQPLVRSGLRVIMADHPGLEVVGEAATGAEAVQLVMDVSPDVVVMDIGCPAWTGSRPLA